MTTLVRYPYFRQHGIFNNRTTLARAIRDYGFPKPIVLGIRSIAWNLDEVEAWLLSRPLRAPKAGDHVERARVAREQVAYLAAGAGSRFR